MIVVYFEFFGKEPIENVITCMHYKIDKVVYFMKAKIVETRNKVDEFMVGWAKNSVKIGGIIFGVLGAISVIFPLADLSKNNFAERVRLFIEIFILVVFVALVYTAYVKYKKRKTIYSVGKTKIIFEYEDIRRIVFSNPKATFVVPIHSRLDLLWDEEKISQYSVHKILFDFFNENGISIDTDFLNQVEKKQITETSKEGTGRIGDWYLITSKEMKIDSDLKFLLIEENEVEEKRGGFLGLKALSKEEYVYGLISLVRAILDSVEQEECIYIPLIGAGKANAAKPREVMFLMEEILRFYKGDLRHEIHVVINEKDRKQGAEIYHLREIL